MSRYVKEMMMSQLRQDFGDTKSLLILDLKGLDAMSEYQFRRDLRKKSIHVRTLKNNLAAKVFEDLGIHGLDRFLTGPSVAVWGGDGVAELAKEISKQVKSLKHTALKIAWSMRGSISYEEAILMSNEDREIAIKIINENMETTKKTGLPYF